MGQGGAGAGEATGAGKAPQGISPARALQVQRGDLQFGSSHGCVWIGEGGAAKAPAHPWQGQKAHAQAIEQGRQGHGTAS